VNFDLGRLIECCFHKGKYRLRNSKKTAEINGAITMRFICDFNEIIKKCGIANIQPSQENGEEIDLRC
jgi:hypothetical protein